VSRFLRRSRQILLDLLGVVVAVAAVVDVAERRVAEKVPGVLEVAVVGENSWLGFSGTE
jgi:hypothetical protein